MKNIQTKEAPQWRIFTIEDFNPLSGNTKKRLIRAPNEAMRLIHRETIKDLRKLNIPMPHATAFKPGSSPRKNVEIHKMNRYFYLTDIHNAYGSVRGDVLVNILIKIKPELEGIGKDAVQAWMRDICLDENDALVVGGPASPDLFNIYAAFLIDEPLAELCRKYRLTYTRYGDDLTFSGQEIIGCKKRDKIRKILNAVGFEVSHRKSKVLDVFKQPIFINGIGLAKGGRIFLPGKYKKKIKAQIKEDLRNRILSRRTTGMFSFFKSFANASRALPNSERRIHDFYRRLRFCARAVKIRNQ